MRELTSEELGDVSGGLRAIWWSMVSSALYDAAKGGFGYLTGGGRGGGSGFRDGEATVVANVYGA